MNEFLHAWLPREMATILLILFSSQTLPVLSLDSGVELGFANYDGGPLQGFDKWIKTRRKEVLTLLHPPRLLIGPRFCVISAPIMLLIAWSNCKDKQPTITSPKGGWMMSLLPGRCDETCVSGRWMVPESSLRRAILLHFAFSIFLVLLSWSAPSNEAHRRPIFFFFSRNGGGLLPPGSRGRERVRQTQIHVRLELFRAFDVGSGGLHVLTSRGAWRI